MEEKVEEKPKGIYGKRPMWQWILIYLVVGGIVYALIYFIFLRQGVSSPY